MIKILGIFDILTGILFLVFGIFNFYSNFILLLGLILLIKGIIFGLDINIVSVFDIFSAMIIITSSFLHVNFFIVILVSGFLIQKGVFSLRG